MPDTRIERGTCRFVARKGEGGRPAITLQFFHGTVSILNYAALRFNLLSALTLEQAKKLADVLNENILDASVRCPANIPCFGVSFHLRSSLVKREASFQDTSERMIPRHS
jgi:hypothetical protein